MIITIDTEHRKYKNMRSFVKAPRSINSAENGKNNTTESLDKRDKTCERYEPIAFEFKDAAAKRDVTTKLSTITDSTKPNQTII